jgi:hypothetical protein
VNYRMPGDPLSLFNLLFILGAAFVLGVLLVEALRRPKKDEPMIEREHIPLVVKRYCAYLGPIENPKYHLDSHHGYAIIDRKDGAVIALNVLPSDLEVFMATYGDEECTVTL